MTFAKPNASRNVTNTFSANVYELNRFAVKSNMSIPGIASKLLSRFIKEHQPKEIVSYADKRWCDKNDNLYLKLGFKLINENTPGYWYIEGMNRKHRFNFTKKKTVQMGGSPDLTEWENMQALGYDRIWDCGTLKYSLTP